MINYTIEKLLPENYDKCNNIWDMSEYPKYAKRFYNDLLSGNRIIFVYIENGEYLGEGALVFDKDGDSDYTIKSKRIYVSRMNTKAEYRNRGIGGIILDYLIDYAKGLGFEEISVGVNKDNAVAKHLYEKKGFDTVIFDGKDDLGEYVKLLKKL